MNKSINKKINISINENINKSANDDDVINRINVVKKYNPHLSKADAKSPLTVGNGRLCFTADVTGMQTLYEEYSEETPLCTMAEWAWHTYPGKSYTMDDVRMTEYDFLGRKVSYPRVKYEGNEDAYDGVRMNPHKFNLARIAMSVDGEYMTSDMLSDINQILDITTGVLKSDFTVNYASSEYNVSVETICDNKSDTVAFKVESELLKKGLCVDIHFPYASCDITGSDWSDDKIHYDEITDNSNAEIEDKVTADVNTEMVDKNSNYKNAEILNKAISSKKVNNIYQIKRQIDDTHYSVNVKTNGQMQKSDKHRYRLNQVDNDNVFYLCVQFVDEDGIYDSIYNNVQSNIGADNNKDNAEDDVADNSIYKRQLSNVSGKSDIYSSITNSKDMPDYYENYGKLNAKDIFAVIKENVHTFWRDYWNSGKFFYYENDELMRRVILSQYLLIINDSGYIPPAETGLTCNSWYGKAHLEMHYWHMAWAALWGHPELLERSFDWYISILPEAEKNAARNGYKGARWTKMVSYTGKDCPSKIAPLLIWQQPHIINMLDMVRDCYENDVYIKEKTDKYMRRYWILVKETAEFMEDYLVYDIDTDTFNIEAPVIPVQERHLPEDTRNPVFELAYFRFGLKVAAEWADKLGYVTLSEKWNNIADRIAPLPVIDGLYISHENCSDTYINKAIDHPLMLQVYGMLDGYGAKNIVDMDVYRATLDKVMEVWDYSTLWGWDFAVIAMAADKLGLKSEALSQLLIESPKNEYVISGNNRQNSRKDLPLYLPGNGSLLIAVAKMLFE